MTNSLEGIYFPSTIAAIYSQLASDSETQWCICTNIQCLDNTSNHEEVGWLHKLSILQFWCTGIFYLRLYNNVCMLHATLHY